MFVSGVMAHRDNFPPSTFFFLFFSFPFAIFVHVSAAYPPHLAFKKVARIHPSVSPTLCAAPAGYMFHQRLCACVQEEQRQHSRFLASILILLFFFPSPSPL